MTGSAKAFQRSAVAMEDGSSGSRGGLRRVCSASVVRGSEVRTRPGVRHLFCECEVSQHNTRVFSPRQQRGRQTTTQRIIIV